MQKQFVPSVLQNNQLNSAHHVTPTRAHSRRACVGWHLESVCASATILAWLPRTRPNQCIRSRARDSFGSVPPNEYLCLHPGCACWLDVSPCKDSPVNLPAAH